MKIPLCKPSTDQAELKAIKSVLESGWLTHGPFNEEFEELFAKIKNLYFEKLDISDPVDIESCIERIIGKWEKIDVWINCAYPRTADWGRWMDDITFDSWNKNIQAHLGGYFWTSKLVLNHMKKRRSGKKVTALSWLRTTAQIGTIVTLACSSYF